MNDMSVTTLQPMSRLKLTVAVILLCTVLGSSYLLYASQRVKQTAVGQPVPAEQLTSLQTVLTGVKGQPTPGDAPVTVQSTTITARESISASVAGPTTTTTSTTAATADLLLFVNRFGGADEGRLAVVNTLQPDKRALLDLRCVRAHMAAGVGICLQSAEEAQDSDGLIILFNEQFQETRRYYLMGSPSRTRVAPDGTLAAYTIFVTGHSYTGGVGTFSTDTRIVDTQRDYRIALEDFKAYRNGEPFRHIDFNYWGVTFAQAANRFYATLGTQGKTYIVEGDVEAQTIQIVTEDGECPSLSPDNRRLVFKERQGGGLSPLHWQLVAYDLTTGERTPLGETRSVDDQVEWVDNDTIIYALPDDGATAQRTTQLWTLDLTPGSQPQRYLANAESPAVVQQGAGASSGS